MSASKPNQQVPEGVFHTVGVRRGQTRWNSDPESVAQTPSIFGGGKSPVVGQADLDQAQVGDELTKSPINIEFVDAAGLDLVAIERTKRPHEVVDLVAISGLASVHQALQLEFKVGQHSGVEELTQLFSTE